MKTYLWVRTADCEGPVDPPEKEFFTNYFKLFTNKETLKQFVIKEGIRSFRQGMSEDAGINRIKINEKSIKVSFSKRHVKLSFTGTYPGGIDFLEEREHICYAYDLKSKRTKIKNSKKILGLEIR